MLRRFRGSVLRARSGAGARPSVPGAGRRAEGPVEVRGQLRHRLEGVQPREEVGLAGPRARRLWRVPDGCPCFPPARFLGGARIPGKVRDHLVTELSCYFAGWRGYFGFCETPSVLRRLDRWVRRRLRAIVWRQWKRGRTRFAALRRLDVNRQLAARTAGSAHGPWRISNSPALSYALPNAFFDRLGLASVASPATA